MGQKLPPKLGLLYPCKKIDKSQRAPMEDASVHHFPTLCHDVSGEIEGLFEAVWYMFTAQDILPRWRRGLKMNLFPYL
jgi:hypothetical protein